MNVAGKALLFVFAVCFIVSLFLPGIIYKPADARDINGRTLYGYDILSLDSVAPISELAVTGQANFFLWVSVLYGVPLRFILVAMILWLSPGGLAWYANVLALFAITNLKYRRLRYACLFSFGAVVIALDAFMYREEFGTFQPEIPDVVDHLGSGFYVWEFSLLILCLLCLYEFYRTKRGNN